MPRQVDNTNTSGQDMSLDSPTCVSLDGTEWRSIQRTAMEEQHGGRGREEGSEVEDCDWGGLQRRGDGRAGQHEVLIWYLVTC